MAPGLTAWTAALSVLAAAVLLLGGCAQPGALPAPHALATADSLGLQPSAAAAAASDWPAEAWWQRYGDADLNRLVAQALAGQPTLAQAQARVAQAQALVGGAQALGRPQLGLSADLTDQRFTENGTVPKPLAGSVKWNNSVQLGGSWELDLFGRQRAALDAALGQARAAEADAQAARHLLAANVVVAHAQLARHSTQLDLARQALALRERQTALATARARAGLDNQAEQRSAETGRAQQHADLEALAETAQRARHALAELTGQQPQALGDWAPRQAAPGGGATPLVMTLPAALPADLLGRRADLVAQRWRVEAALQDVQQARTQFYPSVNLTAFVGLSSLGLDRLVEAGSRTYGVGPALRLPIFEGGRLRAQLGARAAEADVAIEAYNTTLLRALREVADELATLQSLQRQATAQNQATQGAQAALALAQQRFQAGLGNVQPTLAAQMALLQQQRAAVELQARQRVAEATLARALGGGYAEAAPASVSPAQTAGLARR